MINHNAARNKIADLLDVAVTDATVQRAGVDAVAIFPSIIVGMPRWRSSTEIEQPYRFDRSTFPVAVVVGRGSADSSTIDQLEALWPAVIEALRAAIKSDRTLDGSCCDSNVTDANFGQFAVQGQNYPAQLILIDLYG